MRPTLDSAPRRLSFEARDGGGFGAYHDLYAGGSTVSRLGSGFGARVTAHRFPRLLAFDRQVAGAAHHRDPARIRRDGLDHFNLQVLRAGRMAAGAPGEERTMEPGDVAVFDTSRPQRTAVERADYVVISLSRDVVEAALPDAWRMHGAVLPRGGAGLLGDFIVSLVRHASTMGTDMAARGSEMVAELLAGAAGAAPPKPFDGDEPAHTQALNRVRGEAYIDASLSDPNLCAEGIAAALGLSRSSLYRAFAPTGGVAERITARRLGRLRAPLRRPGEHRTVAALAFEAGFASDSHCNRAFKAAYGVTPGQFRADARAFRGARAGDGPADRFDDWFGELR